MKAALVHAVLARAVHDPLRLAEWASAPQALSALGINPASLDLDALRHFCGLALKVRHNGLRDAYPHSFRLLDVAGLEIELFAAYAVAHAATGRALAAGDDGRAQALIDFVQQWHDPEVAAQALLWDLLRHEQALSQLVGNDDAAAEPLFAPLVRPTATSVPHVRGAVRLLELQHDPRLIVPLLLQNVPDLAAAVPSSCLLCYWRAPATSAAVLVELDDFGFAVMRLADGRRSVADIVAALGLGRRVPANILKLLQQLQHAGLLDFAARGADASKGAAA